MSFPKPPKPSEIRAAREAAGLTQAQAGALIYKSMRTWQSWEAADVNAMDPAFWELWQIKAKGLKELRQLAK